MKAVLISKPLTYEIKDIPIPKITRPDQVLVKMDAASICGTDVRLLAAPDGGCTTPPMILGHEAVGTIAEIGEAVKSVAVGDRVVLNPVVGCGTCFGCRMGMPNMCENVNVIGCTSDGYFCEYTVSDERQVLKIDRNVPLEQAIFAEPLSCVLGGMKKIKVAVSDNVLIFGGGPIGLYFAQLAKLSGAAKVIVSEISPFRAEYALRLGVDYVVNPQEEDLLQRVLEITNGVGADICIDAVGCLLPEAIRCARKNGTILVFGQSSNGTQKLVESDIVEKALRIFGNIQGDHTFGQAVRLLESGQIDFTQMITHKLKIDDFGIGIEAMKSGTALEVVLYF